MSDSYIGEIQAFPYSFAAQGFQNAWFPCFGQILPIQAYTPLFSLIGTYYGGNGQTNFALPNLNGYIANSQGDAPGLQPRSIGEVLGTPAVNLTVGQMPSHTHGLQLGARSAQGAAAGPGTASNTAAIDPFNNGFVVPPSNTTLAMNAMALTGQGLAHDNNQPTQAIVYCICYNGIFPSFGQS